MKVAENTEEDPVYPEPKDEGRYPDGILLCLVLHLTRRINKEKMPFRT
jgi:hypothetical protein